MGTRAFRLALPAEAVVFGLDQEALLAEKQAVLDGERAQPRCRRMAVPVNLRDDAWLRP